MRLFRAPAMSIQLFSQEVFLKEVRTLMPTQEKIKTLALYMKTLAAYSTRMVQILDKEFQASNAHHKLNLLYLANELLLNIKNGDREQMLLKEQIINFVMMHFQTAQKEMSQNKSLQSKLNDLKKIWFDRKIFTPESIGEPSLQEPPFHEPIQSLNQPLNQSQNQALNQSQNYSSNQPLNQSQNYSSNQPLNQSQNYSSNQPLNQSQNYSLNHPTNTYSKEEIHQKIEEFFEAKRSLATYLEGLVDKLKRNGL
ncbi:Regulator of nuclear mRNA [Pseudoloma neurophilia]|uniref:Regulator of nuclear mRNA n=1 Tax=Pseudoloma neurophilia TaxID=146866 RepID=A0A0R0LZN3_9MICR|nr:Regulator of nuclear mRNA [Pseudoloma neurophilia]